MAFKAGRAEHCFIWWCTAEQQMPGGGGGAGFGRPRQATAPQCDGNKIQPMEPLHNGRSSRAASRQVVRAAFRGCRIECNSSPKHVQSQPAVFAHRIQCVLLQPSYQGTCSGNTGGPQAQGPANFECNTFSPLLHRKTVHGRTVHTCRSTCRLRGAPPSCPPPRHRSTGLPPASA